MKNSNIIISIVIVLCIAAGVTAYELTTDEGIFSNLATFTPSEDTSGDINNPTGSDGVGEGNSNSGSNGEGQSSSGGTGSNSDSRYGMASNEAKKIVNSRIEEDGAYAGTPKWIEDRKSWYVVIYDSEGNQVDGMDVDPKTGHTSRA